MTTLTISSILIAFLGGFTRVGWPRALALGGVTPAGAALVIGTVAVPTFDFVAVLAIAHSLWKTMLHRQNPAILRQPIPALIPLTIFGLWTFAVTLVAPILFNGFAVTGPDVGSIHVLSSAGQPASSNIAQLTYLAIAIGVIVILARELRATAEAVGLALAVSTILSFWALLHRDFGLAYPVGVFDNSPSFRYINSAAGGLERFRGVFPEPAALATWSLATVAFIFPQLARVSGWRRIALMVVLVFAVWNASISTSTTLIVAGVILAVIVITFLIARFTLRGRRVHPLALLAGVLAGTVLLFILPLLANYVSATVADKTDSASYDQRTFADTFSYGLFLRTFGLGVGIGSNRPSSFLPALLSTTGIIGTVLFLGVIAFLLIKSWPDPSLRPVIWSYVALLICKFIASPDLGDTSGLTWIGLGVLAHGVWLAREERSQPRALNLLAKSAIRTS